MAIGGQALHQNIFSFILKPLDVWKHPISQSNHPHFHSHSHSHSHGLIGIPIIHFLSYHFHFHPHSPLVNVAEMPPMIFNLISISFQSHFHSHPYAMIDIPIIYFFLYFLIKPVDFLPLF